MLTARRALIKANPLRGRELIVARTLALREALHRTFVAMRQLRAPESSDLALIAAESRDAESARTLAYTGRAVRWQWKDKQDVRRPLHELALVVILLLTSEQTGELQKCAANDCGVWFMDSSRTRRRRWCAMSACGNREKVRRFRS